MNEDIRKTWNAIQETLREMDIQSPLGLRGWKSYRPLTKGGKTDEPAITIDLTQRLFDIGRPAFAEVVYPRRQPGDGIQYCDVVVDLGNWRYFWIEAKVLWTEFHNDKKSIWEDPLKKDAPARVKAFHDDCKRLLALRRPEASFIGGLVIAFETSRKKLSDDVVKLLTSGLFDWQPCHNPDGPDPIPSKPIDNVECSNRMWFWHRSVTDGQE